jgi:hypothetical protein
MEERASFNRSMIFTVINSKTTSSHGRVREILVPTFAIQHSLTVTTSEEECTVYTMRLMTLLTDLTRPLHIHIQCIETCVLRLVILLY